MFLANRPAAFGYRDNRQNGRYEVESCLHPLPFIPSQQAVPSTSAPT